ncbi:hypothetical protein [Actinoplanes palleronii]|uniref:Uncharacterized protein n=1 Tax=Actinoplanes palleronii TaxID=113570 RepID=A0ABQ4BNB3_9ACTN|nr:hypothetical protein [Actinoplanes palleronii]GIE72135.1 hypothetical protein Apa02nite_082430 [Actinoplanes palleronii]
MYRRALMSGLMAATLLAGTATPASASPAGTGDAFTDHVTGKISQFVSGRAFSRHEDDVRRRRVLGVETCSGHERWVDGTVGVPAVTVTGDMSSGFDGSITLPYQASYRHKNFSGVLCEYQTEEKNPTGTLQIGIRITMGTTGVTQYDVVTSDPSTDHDATRMSTTAIRDGIVDKIRENL